MSGDSGPRAWLKRLSAVFEGMPESREELLRILREACRRGLMDGDALTMMEGVLGVSDLRVRDIMIPRAHMVVIRREADLDELLPVVVESAHSRFPVIAEDRSEVVGILLAKDLLAYCADSARRRRFNVRDILRSAVFVPESKRLNVLLNEFRSGRNHMAIVVDEYGNAAGLVTIEDVLEQIVGEIEDEHDLDEEDTIYRRDEGDYTLKAQTPVEDFNEYFHADLSDDEFDTVGGLVTKALGHMPKRGEEVTLGRFRFKVLRADSRRVRLLGLRLLPDPSADG